MSALAGDAVARFEAGEIGADALGHAEHVQLGFALLRAAPFHEAAARYAAAISRMASAAGRPEAYSATITFAFMSLIGERMACGGHRSYDAFAAANADLFDRTILASRYSEARLRSPVARAMFLLPDRPHQTEARQP